MEEKKESKELIEIKKGIWQKIKEWFKRFSAPKNKVNYEESKSEKIEENTEIESKDNIIDKMKKAYEVYNLNSDPYIERTIYELLKERIEANIIEINKIIDLDDAKITFDDIEEIWGYEYRNIDEYKNTLSMRKIDDKFMYSLYKVPKGLIKVYSSRPVMTIRQIFKAITTRNSIVVVEDNYSEYSVQNLVLLIAQELLKKFNIDENIIQIIPAQEDIEDKFFDVVMSIDKVSEKEKTNNLYIYMEDEYFKNIVINEAKQLKIDSLNPKIITGDMDEAIEKINATQNLGVSIYTQDRKKAYKFINLINSDNVFFNATIREVKEARKLNDNYFRAKNIVYEYRGIENL